ncbi:VRR-NUC domain-containing protein [Candidatus Gracilibacteria bacterium]|nr:MAG: VRR-NUC domain-containing protein [Candidatus Gracilibacteria bacterium]
MKENIIQKSIINYLQLKENLGELYFFRSGAGAVRVTGQNRDRFFKTGKAGCPDITVVKDGRFIGLEVKTEKGKQSEAQKLAEEKILKAGGEYYIVRSVEDVISLGI